MKYIPPVERTFVPLTFAANKLGVPSAWLLREAQSGRIPAIRAGRRWLVHLERTRTKLAEYAERGAGGEQ